jgi:hypothetical protein
MAYALWRASLEVSADWRACGNDALELETLSVDLPMSAQRVVDAVWAGRLLERLEHIERCLAAGMIDRLVQCPADEIAAFLVLTHAENEVFLGCLELEEGLLKLPAYEEDEHFLTFAAERLSDLVFEMLLIHEDGHYLSDRAAIDGELAGLQARDWFDRDRRYRD